jgi:7-cyano-7-deazaguanine synthase in queuosine biosynthesis
MSTNGFSDGTGTLSSVKVLWTGGWDSSFRVVWLMSQAASGTVIEPYYVVDPQRASTSHELRAIAEIAEVVKQRFGNRGVTLRPLIQLTQEQVTETVRDSYRALCQQHYIGPQYAWLASTLAGSRVTDLELCIHVDDRAHTVVRPWSRVSQDSLGPFYELDKTRDVPDALETIFGWYRFPILDWSKRRMADWATASGALDILERSWFCHNPTRQGRACGTCGPCIYTIEEGLSRRLSRRARVAYHLSIKRRLRPLLRAITGAARG